MGRAYQSHSIECQEHESLVGMGNMLLRSFCTVVACAVVGVASVSIAEDQEASKKSPPKHPVETKQFVLTVTDGENPIAGASLRLYACRCEEDRGSHYGWPSNNTDVPTIFTTDETGKATLRYPIKFGDPSNWKTLSQISLFITHSDYVGDELHVDPRDGEATKELKQGCELTFSAVDDSREPVDIAVLMAGPGRSAKWERGDDKVVRSRAIPDGSWQTMLVSPRDDGRHLFSGILPVRLANQQAVKIRNLRIKPGFRLSGRLSDNVPRPVKNGSILANCYPKPAGRVWGDDNPSLNWTTVATVHEDGSFDFSSLPRGGRIQILAVCDGWAISDDSQQNSIKDGRLIEFTDLEIDEDGVCNNYELPMEPTGTVIVTVKKPDGSPLAGSSVSTNPNQRMYLGGTSIFGQFYESIDGVRYEISGEESDGIVSRRHANKAVAYHGVTDEKGQFTIRGVPLNRNYQVGASHTDYASPIGERGRRERTSYICKSAEPIEVEIQLQTRFPDSGDGGE